MVFAWRGPLSVEQVLVVLIFVVVCYYHYSPAGFEVERPLLTAEKLVVFAGTDSLLKARVTLR